MVSCSNQFEAVLLWRSESSSEEAPVSGFGGDPGRFFDLFWDPLDRKKDLKRTMESNRTWVVGEVDMPGH